ncbi:MAG: WXG100 family type VII secretion target [Lachnospiraceae bacterium]|nr:WXG100 family type VII secretion target [Lachnospiraceae bacterium]
MAAATIKVDTKKLTSTATAFQNTGNAVKTLTNNMTSTVKELTGNVWSGDAAIAYNKKFDGLQDDINKMINMINEHVTDLQAMAAEYEKAEAANIDATNALSADVII